ncbi:MAG: hypothetical protein E7262_04965 [Lachnospiraceae bacterium]|nr:hypothetical protein [Lachnospiraceae bacterium]
MKRFFKKLSNRGSTFVIVITTIGFVGVITSLVLMVTSSGYQTKAIDNQAKNNFYSAEEIIDQIKTGLHNEMAKEIMSSYFTVLTSYRQNFASDTMDSDARITALNNVQREFKELVIGDSGKGFIKRIKKAGASGQVVDPLKLTSYVSNVPSEDTFLVGAQKVASGSNDITYDYSIVDTPTGPQASIAIRNIGITYTNDMGYTNNVYTDIKMTIPDLNFEFLDFDRNTEFTRYAIMSKKDTNFQTTAANSEAAIIGNFWVGEDLNISGTAKLKTLADYGYVGKTLELRATNNTPQAPAVPSNGYTSSSMFEMNILTDYNGYYQGHMYSKSTGSVRTYDPTDKVPSLKNKLGDTKYDTRTVGGATSIKRMYKNSSTTTQKIGFGDTFLAVNSIIMNGSNSSSRMMNMINTDTNLLVHNDMLFNVDYAHADIMQNYHGYGYSTEKITGESVADDCSAIILNNKNCDLDMNLKSLSILGSAYIKTNAASADYTQPYAASDVLTGDSLIVRGNQIAYLVPAKYIPGYGTNPVTLSETGGSVDFDAFARTIENEVKTQNNPLYREYFKPYIEDGTYYYDAARSDRYDSFVKPIYYRYSASSSDYVVYYYFEFYNAALAAKYYNEATDGGTRILSNVTKETLLGLIPASINVSVDTIDASSIMGNYITDLESTAAGIPTGSPYSMGRGGASSNTTNGVFYANQAANMKSFLKETVPKSMEDEIDASTGDRKILKEYKDRDAIDNIIDWSTFAGEPSDIINQMYTENGQNCQIIVKKGDHTVTATGGQTMIVITQGNIRFADGANVKGLFIAGGPSSTITIGRNVTIESNEAAVESVFRNAATLRTNGGQIFNKMFRGYDYENSVGQESEFSVSAGTIINLNEMFTYENWSRQ